MNDLANETATSPTPQLIQPFHGEIKFRFQIQFWEKLYAPGFC